MMQFAGLIALALLAPETAQGASGSEPYATVGAWEIVPEPERKLCKMYRVRGSNVDNHKEGLFVRYDATKEDVWLTWTTDKELAFPADGKADFSIELVSGKSLNRSWGTRTFDYRKPAQTYYFSHTFSGSRNSRRMLRDLATSDIFGLFSGETLMTAMKLDASEAVAKLSECSLQASGQARPLLSQSSRNDRVSH